MEPSSTPRCAPYRWGGSRERRTSGTSRVLAMPTQSIPCFLPFQQWEKAKTVPLSKELSTPSIPSVPTALLLYVSPNGAAQGGGSLCMPPASLPLGSTLFHPFQARNIGLRVSCGSLLGLLRSQGSWSQKFSFGSNWGCTLHSPFCYISNH